MLFFVTKMISTNAWLNSKDVVLDYERSNFFLKKQNYLDEAPW